MSEDFIRHGDEETTTTSGLEEAPSWPTAHGVTQRAGEESSRHLVVVNERGLHLRAAARLVLVASRFSCRLAFERAGHSATGKSVMELLMLRATKGATIRVTATGDGAQECLDAMVDLVARGFEDDV